MIDKKKSVIPERICQGRLQCSLPRQETHHSKWLFYVHDQMLEPTNEIKKRKRNRPSILFNNPIPILNYQYSKVKQWWVLLLLSSHILHTIFRREGTFFLFCQSMIFYFNILKESIVPVFVSSTHRYITDNIKGD